jgi:hypothetical protein
LLAGVTLIFALGGFAGAAHALVHILSLAVAVIGVTAIAVLVVAVYAVRYEAFGEAVRSEFGARGLLAMLASAAGLGAIAGVLWFASELPGDDGWILVGGVLAGVCGGGLLGLVTARRGSSTP